MTCIQSKYQLEGKLPTGIYLVNQLTEGKKHVDYLEFQSELRVVPQAEIQAGQIAKLTGINSRSPACWSRTFSTSIR